MRSFLGPLQDLRFSTHGIMILFRNVARFALIRNGMRRKEVGRIKHDIV